MGKKEFSLLFSAVALLAFTFFCSSSASAQLPPPPPPPPFPDPEVMRLVMGDFFHLPVSQITRFEADVPFPDLNLPVALFVSRHAHVSVDLILQWRRTGQSWLQISNRLKLAPTIYFLPISERRMGPPYGNAYGYYWKHKKDRRVQIIVSDREISDLVHLNISTSYFGLPPSQIMGLRAGGNSFSQIYGQEYRKRHPGKAKGEAGGGKGGPKEHKGGGAGFGSGGGKGAGKGHK